MKNIIFLFLLLFIYAGLQAQTPQEPVIDSVSVDVSTQRIRLAWTVENPDTITGFFIYRNLKDVPGSMDGLHIIDTVMVASMTTVEGNTSTVDDNTTTVDDNTTTVDDNTTTVDDNTTTVDDNTTTVDDNTTTVDDNTTTVDDNTTTVDDNTTTVEDNPPQIEKEVPVPGGTGYNYEDIIELYGGAQPGGRPEMYSVAAFRLYNDSMYISIYSIEHTTIFLSDLVIDECRGTISLSWSDYGGWENDLKEYQIFGRTDTDDAPELLATVSADVNSYKFSEIEPQTTYYYFVRAINNDGRSSSSNEKSIFADIDELPDDMSLNNVTTISSTNIAVSLSLDPVAPVNKYILLRTDTASVGFDTIATFDNSEPGIVYIDTVESTTYDYTYKMTVINTCDIEYKTTDEMSNIVFNAAEDGSDQNLIHTSWEEYINWPNDVIGYNLYRSVNGDEHELIKITEDFSFTDDIQSIKEDSETGSNGVWSFCYYIEAVEGEGTDGASPHNSKSNEMCITQLTQIILPNAFNPLSSISKNRTFKPVLPDVTNYSMIIYSRWGVKIFESTDVSEGWDGTVNGGKLAAEGVYIYHISYTSKAGDEYKTGYITVIYP